MWISFSQSTKFINLGTISCIEWSPRDQMVVLYSVSGRTELIGKEAYEFMEKFRRHGEEQKEAGPAQDDVSSDE